MSNEQQSGKMWSGRFREPLDEEFEQWQRSIVFDWRLLEQELRPARRMRLRSRAAGVLTENETAGAAHCAWMPWLPEFSTESGREQGAQPSDCGRHSSFCRAVAGGAGGLAGAESCTPGARRNEQIATDLRLYVRGQIERVVECARELGRLRCCRQAGNAGDA